VAGGLVCWKRAPEGCASVVCFPWAGGGAAPFRHWAEWLPEDVGLWAVRLAGREARLSERPIDDLERLVAELADEVAALESEPFAFFGHCSGALIAFELTRELRRRDAPLPLQLLATSQPAPRLSRIPPSSERDLAEGLRRLGGTSDRVLADRELFGLLRPAIEADLRLVESYAYASEPPLDVPIAVFAVEDDDSAALSSFEAWREETTRPFALVVLEGDHLFTGPGWRVLADAVGDRLVEVSVTQRDAAA
jgi:surfactin synthase thioesterase subunit